MKYYWDKKNTAIKRYILCLCLLPAIIMLLVLVCFWAMIGGLHDFYKDIKEVLGDLFFMFKNLLKRINNGLSRMHGNT